MEENTFLDNNPQFNVDTTAIQQGYNHDIEGDNAITRFFHPGIAEDAAFQREQFNVDKENAFNEYMWNKANEYNSPAAQMERAKAAGINPNLMAAGIAGAGGNQAIPMQGAQGNSPMSNNTLNPIEQLGTIANATQGGVNAINTLGEIFGFGEKNKAVIQEIKENAKNTAEQMKYTRRQRIQLEKIGNILVENEKTRGKELEQNIKNLEELNNNYKKERDVMQADSDLKKAQEGETLERTKTQKYENYKREFEKVFRDTFGIELTHGQIQMLVEACLNGKGDIVIDYFIKTLGKVKDELFKKTKEEIIPIGEKLKDAHDQFIERAKDKRIEREQKRIRKLHQQNEKKWRELWQQSSTLREAYNNDYREYLRVKYKQFKTQKGYSARWK